MELSILHKNYIQILLAVNLSCICSRLGKPKLYHHFKTPGLNEYAVLLWCIKTFWQWQTPGDQSYIYYCSQIRTDIVCLLIWCIISGGVPTKNAHPEFNHKETSGKLKLWDTTEGLPCIHKRCANHERHDLFYKGCYWNRQHLNRVSMLNFRFAYSTVVM